LLKLPGTVEADPIGGSVESWLLPPPWADTSFSARIKTGIDIFMN
jgi:hypothetical protein